MADEKVPADYNFKNLSFEACAIIDSVFDQKNRGKIIEFLQKTNNVRAAMIMDWLGKTEKLRSDATLEDYVKYAMFVKDVEGSKPSAKNFDIQNDTAKAIVASVAEAVSGLDKATINALTGGVDGPETAKMLAFAGAVMEYVRAAHHTDMDFGDALKFVAEKSGIADADKVMRKFEDKGALWKYHEKRLEQDPTDAGSWAGRAKLEIEDGKHESALSDLLEAAYIDSDYTDSLLNAIKSQTSNSKLMNDFYSRALGKVDNPELLFALHSVADVETAIQLLEEAAKLKPDARYYLSLGNLYVKNKDATKAGASLASAIECDKSKFGEIFSLVSAAGMISALHSAMESKGLDFGEALDKSSAEMRAQAIKQHVCEPDIFEYAISRIGKLQDVHDLSLTLHNDKNILDKITAQEAEQLGDMLISKGHAVEATAWYDKAISMRQSIGLHWKKYQANAGSLTGFKSLLEAIKFVQKIKLYDAYSKVIYRGALKETNSLYPGILECAEKEVLRQPTLVKYLLNAISNNSIVVSQNIQLCDRLAEKSRHTDAVIASYAKLSELAGDGALKNLDWQEDKFLRAVKFSKNDVNKLRFLNASLQKYPCAYNSAIKKGDLLFAQDKQTDALQTILTSAKTLSDNKDASLQTALDLYRSKVAEWIKTKLSEEEIKNYINFSVGQGLHTPEQWSDLGNLLEKERKLMQIAFECLNWAHLLSGDDRYVLRCAEISDNYDKNKAINIFINLMGTTIRNDALTAISKRVRSGSYDASNLELLLTRLQDKKIFDKKVTADDALSIIDAAKEVNNLEHKNFVSSVYDIVCPIKNNAALYADKASVEFDFDKTKSLESAIKAAELDKSSFDIITDRGYDVQLLQQNFDKLLSLANNAQHATKLADIFIDEKAIEYAATKDKFVETELYKRSEIGLSALKKSHELDATPALGNRIGKLCEHLYYLPDALEFYKKAATADDNYRNVKEFSERRFSAKGYELALDGYVFVLESTRDDPTAELGAGRCMLELGQANDAITHFDKVSGFPAFWRDGALYWKSVALEILGNTKDALATINSIDVANFVSGGEVTPAHAGILYGLAQIYPEDIFAHKINLELRLGKAEDADKTFEIMPSNIKPDFTIQVSYALASAAYGNLSKKYDEPKAYELATRSNEKYPNWLSCYVLGMCDESHNYYRGAISQYSRAMILADTPAAASNKTMLFNALKRCSLKFRECDESGFTAMVKSGELVNSILENAYTSKFGRFGASEVVYG